jgi:hypothetical protein
VSDPRRVFVVARVAWKVDPHYDGYTGVGLDTIDTPHDGRRFVPVAAFADRPAAAARARELELDAARLFNPFCLLGPLSVLTSLPEIDFRPRLDELAGPLPDAPLDADGRTRHWRPWWDEHAPAWPDELLAEVWDLFDRVRFHAVLEVDAE